MHAVWPLYTALHSTCLYHMMDCFGIAKMYRFHDALLQSHTARHAIVFFVSWGKRGLAPPLKTFHLVPERGFRVSRASREPPSKKDLLLWELFAPSTFIWNALGPVTNHLMLEHNLENVHPSHLYSCISKLYDTIAYGLRSNHKKARSATLPHVKWAVGSPQAVFNLGPSSYDTKMNLCWRGRQSVRAARNTINYNHKLCWIMELPTAAHKSVVIF